jgi:formate-dependent nitrite reductase cytochrome c552 subunit
MPTLRQKVDSFCRDSGAKVDSDKLRRQVSELKEELKKVKASHKKELSDVKKTMKVKKEPKAKTQKVKLTDEEKAQRKRDRAKTSQPAEPMLPAPAAPVAAPTLVPGKGGSYRRRW